jgi:serine/threonine-protein kinase
MKPQTVGHYMIEHELGQGQNGTVYLARDLRRDRRVAIKVLNRRGEPARAEMLQEARLASCLEHRYICTVYDVGEVEAEGGNLDCIAMEYVDGPSLAEILEDGPLRRTTTLRFAVQLCEALAYAHEHGVIHGDVKASNVLITPDGEAKWVDFGSAARSSRQAAASAQGDLWALGVLLYQMATGEDPPPPTLAGLPGTLKVPRSVPKGLAAIIERCVNPDLARRYQSAREVLHDLRVEAERPTSLASWRTWRAERRRLIMAALALTVGSALMVAAVEIARRSQPSQSPPPFHAQPSPPRAAATPGGRSLVREGGRPDVNVWVNSRTMKYHCPDSPWYGRTLTGEYLTQKDAQKAGYAPADGAVCP